MKQKIDNNTIILIVATLLLGVLSFGYIYVFLNVRDKAEKAAQITEAYNAEIGKDTRQTELRTTLRDIKDKVGKLDTYFLHGDTISDFTTSIEGLGALTGTDIVTNSISPKAGDTAVTATFSVEGPFANVLQVVTLFENLPYKVEMKDVSMGFLGDAAAGGEVSVGTQADAVKTPGNNIWKAVVIFDITSYIKR